MKKLSLEALVGIFLIAGFLCFGWLSVKLGDVQLFGNDAYPVSARFSSISGLKVGANVEIAGVPVGKVSAIQLNGKDFRAEVQLDIHQGVELQDDCIASIRTAGIIGDRYISISPGGSPDLIAPGGEITETEGAINLEELISKYIFEGNPGKK